MPRYLIKYAHMDDTKDFESGIQAGWGEMFADIPDGELQTDDDLKDLARWIGHEKGYTRVGITSIIEVDEEESHESF